MVINADTKEIKLDISNNGINIYLKGDPIYPENSSEHLAGQLERFFQKPTALFTSPSYFQETPDISPVHDKYLFQIQNNIPQKQTGNAAYDAHLDSIPCLVMFGVGTGQQIQQLINLLDIKTLVLIDQDYSMLKASMHLIDWRPIFEYFDKESYSLEFNVHKDPYTTGATVINSLKKNKTFYYNYINIFLTYKTVFFKETYEHIRLNYSKLTYGWGFYDDEIMSIDNTIENINNNIPVFLGNKALPENSHAFIIGSGPSVDNDIAYIKKHLDKAVIISCGSSIKILEQNGITPDYHIEVERTPATIKQLDYISSKFLKKVNFIGLNVIPPEVFSRFKTSKLFFRTNDAGATLAPSNMPKLEHCNPTVINGALAIASEAGFKNIYLFGADMGYKDEKKHHSKYSVYNDSNTVFYDYREAGTINSSFCGNFDKNEKFLSTEIYIWCKQRVQNCIIDYNYRQKKKINYYNCSDGLAIDSTVPLKSSNIILDKASEKDTVINTFEQNFSHNFRKLNKDIKNQHKIQIQISTKIIDNIISIISKDKIISYSQLFTTMDKTFSLLLNTTRDNNSSMAFSLLSGTIIHMYTLIYSHSLLAKNIEDSFEFINYSFNIVISFLQRVKQDIKRYNNFK